MSEAEDQDPFAPRRSAEFIGHPAAEAEFLECYNAGRVPHAWLLAGPRGVGKATLAYRIARFVLAQGRHEGADAPAAAGPGLFGDTLPKTTPTSLHIAPEHPIFRRVASGGHSDFRVYERTVNEKTDRLRRDISVDEIREVPRFLSLTPAEGAWRVVIVDSIDDTNASSANAILKILEEPPARALLLLVSHEPGRLLPTIRSRSRKLWLGPLDDPAMRTLLATRAPELAPDDVELLIRLTEGSIGRALKLAEEGGLELFRDLQKLVASLPRLDLTELHRLGDKVSRDTTGETLRTLGELIDWTLVRLARAAARIESGAAPIALSAARPGSLDRWMEVWEKTRRLFGEAEGLNLDRKQVVLETFLAIEEAAQSGA
jgi:DNA polymerase-3 subunit delta'